MKVPLSWLLEYIDTNASLEKICETLTAIGLEVEEIINPGKTLEPFIVAEVLEAEQHPNADKLRVCKVSTGTEILQIVCGAPNARAGIKVVLARPGDVIPASKDKLKKGVIRGIESQGMMCSARELGLGDNHEGIIELDANAPLGEKFATYGSYDNPVLDINLTPNRPDCAGICGIARDLAAAEIGTLKASVPETIEGTEKSSVSVSLDFPKGDNSCPLFVGRVIRNIKNCESPEWLQKKLISIGLRPISALVDITNYLTIDRARPLHVFDADKIKGNLWVRPAKGGETLEALDNKTYTLEKGMTVIGDDTGVLSLAGVIGGASSACDEGTVSVFVESAYFSPVRTALTGRALQIISDARYRFERGVDPQITIPGIELASKLILDICGTDSSVVSELFVAGSVPDTTKVIAIKTDKCKRHVGVDVEAETQKAILQRLGFKIVSEDNSSFSVSVPSYRPDVEHDTDLVEEVIRIKGYDNIPAVSLPRDSVVTKCAIDNDDIKIRSAKRILAYRGLLECITWSFLSEKEANIFSGGAKLINLLNPISSDLSVMRPGIIPNLLSAALRNANKAMYASALFEVGPVFHDDGQYKQITVAGALRSGHSERNWLSTERPVDAFDAKADALAVLSACGVAPDSLQVSPEAPAWYHPGRSGCLKQGKVLLAYFGEIHPTLRYEFPENTPVVACEVFLDNIISKGKQKTSEKPLLKLEDLQPVFRDFAFVVSKDTPAAKIIQAIKSADKELIKDVSIFDIYEGENISESQKSVAVNVVIQPLVKTMTDEEIHVISSKIIESAANTAGAVLR
ncbi:MAG: phenylalanine--tRNA ligase subunit beta [Alphaproteobacteria bacterium]|nr:phenylalanine--tRNA ligase subunit beta [Alphaproteobacteria bacterium]MCL2506009.1 phenylalanine--tRNA ligase subunit beta [Alphaproteobacteria bacterium]